MRWSFFSSMNYFIYNRLLILHITIEISVSRRPRVPESTSPRPRVPCPRVPASPSPTSQRPRVPRPRPTFSHSRKLLTYKQHTIRLNLNWLNHTIHFAKLLTNEINLQRHNIRQSIHKLKSSGFRELRPCSVPSHSKMISEDTITTHFDWKKQSHIQLVKRC